MSWDPDQYSLYADERRQPLLDLLAAVRFQDDLDVARILDLGCGSGQAIPHLLKRFECSSILALDQSAEMLAKIPKDYRKVCVHTQQADVGSWQPRRPVDLIFSNAALQWLGDHETLFPKMMTWLVKGGVLAVQMPNNWQQPSHQILADVVHDGPWADTLKPHLRLAPVLPLADYEKILKPSGPRGRGVKVQVFEKVYDHMLEGENAVAQWLKGTTLGVLMDQLPDNQAASFWQQYCERIALAYPADKEGKTLFPFHRIFIIAQKN